MSDQAAVWKFAFGMLVLLFCGVTLLIRKDAQPAAAVAPVVSPVPTAPAAAPMPLPPASALPAADEPTPADMPEMQEVPVRIRIALHEAAPVPKKRHHHAAKPALRKVVHRRPHRRPSPYLAGRQHYPFDPRERWNSRDG